MLPKKQDSRDDDIQQAQRRPMVLHVTGPRSHFPLNVRPSYIFSVFLLEMILNLSRYDVCL